MRLIGQLGTPLTVWVHHPYEATIRTRYHQLVETAASDLADLKDTGWRVTEAAHLLYILRGGKRASKTFTRARINPTAGPHIERDNPVIRAGSTVA